MYRAMNVQCYECSVRMYIAKHSAIHLVLLSALYVQNYECTVISAVHLEKVAVLNFAHHSAKTLFFAEIYFVGSEVATHRNLFGQSLPKLNSLSTPLRKKCRVIICLKKLPLISSTSNSSNDVHKN